jgi:uncharacterized MnhB-related membrane protein
MQAVAIAAVAITGGAVALFTDPLRETFLLGIYGFSLAVLFFSLQAPDVGLSEIVVSSIGLPLVVLAALRKVREQERERNEERERGE